MRASRLLRMLLILQNRGRQTSRQLADDLEVSTRTVLRDVDALLEAGLPVIVHQGNRGGIELGFNYRTRLTGLTANEASAIGLLLSHPAPLLTELGVARDAQRAVAKMIESFPDNVRQVIETTQARIQLGGSSNGVVEIDERVPALMLAIREGREVRIRQGDRPRVIHPIGLRHDGAGWSVVDGKTGDMLIAFATFSDINISASRFTRELRRDVTRTE